MASQFLRRRLPNLRAAGGLTGPAHRTPTCYGEQLMEDRVEYEIDREESITHALAHQIPSMHAEVILRTPYGCTTLYHRDAQRVAAIAKTALEKQLRFVLSRKTKAAARKCKSGSS
jgi:hypothetical protein